MNDEGVRVFDELTIFNGVDWEMDANFVAAKVPPM